MMVHQAFGYSFVLTCLYFFRYPLFAGEAALFCFAVGLAAAGAAVQFLLLRKGRRARWFPLLLLGVLAVFEAWYQLYAFHLISGMDVLHNMFFGIVTLYVLLGALAGWLMFLACGKCRRRRGDVQDL